MINTTKQYAKGRRDGFTLIELIVVLGIISLLLALLLPALSSGRHAAMDLECRTKLRAVTTEFIAFADESGAGLRGDSERYGNRFKIEDFQESVYKIDEYWDGLTVDRMTIDHGEQLMMCPAGPSYLERRSQMPCSAGAIGPQKNVSIAFNKRLETRTRYDLPFPAPANAYLTPKILQHPDVPLLLDVAGEKAVADNRLPYYTAPQVLNDKIVDIYESGKHWFPSLRHRGRLNIGFIGGHVLSSSHPTTEPWWKWNYQPDP